MSASLSLKRKRVIHALLIGAVLIANSYIPMVADKPHALQAILLVNVIYGVVFVLLKEGHFVIARIIFIVTPSLSTLLIGHLAYVGPNMMFGSKLTLLSTLVLPLLIIDIRERLLMTTGLLIVIASFFSIEWLGAYFIYPINRPVADAPDWLVHITALLDILIFIFGFLYPQKLTIKSEARVVALLQKERKLRRRTAEEKKK